MPSSFKNFDVLILTSTFVDKPHRSLTTRQFVHFGVVDQDGVCEFLDGFFEAGSVGYEIAEEAERHYGVVVGVLFVCFVEGGV